MNKNINKILLMAASLFLTSISLSSCTNILEHKHEFTSESIKQEATCTEEGITIHKCKSGDFEYEEHTPALGHDFETLVLTEATCTSSGSGYKICKRCNERETYTIPALGHDYSVLITAAKAATCTEDGVTAYYKCSRCNSYSGGLKIDKLGHSVTYKVTKEATCSEIGVEEGTCTRCNKILTRTIETIDHTWSSSSTSATCNKCGTSYYTKGLKFTLNSDDTYSVSIYKGSETSVIIPSSYLKKSVTAISSDAFKNTNITQVSIPDTVKSIGDSAFYECTSLSSIDISHVTTLGSYAFYNCNKATSLSFSSSIITIPTFAFAYCSSLIDVTLGNSINTIEPYAFSECRDLLGFRFPTSSSWKIGDTSIDTSNIMTNATYIKSTYASYKWTRS